MMRLALIAALATVVAFINPARAAGDPQAGKQKATVCAACHGADGNSTATNFPKLAGLSESYLTKQIRDFKAGETRRDPSMAPMVANLSDQDIADISAYYTSLEGSFGVTDITLLDKGQLIYRGGITGSSIGACIGCHGPRGSGNPPARIPAVSGQNTPYLAAQLKKFRSGDRANDPHQMMRGIATRMTDDEIDAVASYMSGLH